MPFKLRRSGWIGQGDTFEVVWDNIRAKEVVPKGVAMSKTTSSAGATSEPVLSGVDSVTLPVPDLEEGLRFYRDTLDHELVWRNDAIGQAGLRLPGSSTELVLSTNLGAAVNWLVTSVADAVASFVAAGGSVVATPREIPVGTVAVVRDPFGNDLVLLDLTRGRYRTDAAGNVIAVDREDEDTPGLDGPSDPPVG